VLGVRRIPVRYVVLADDLDLFSVDQRLQKFLLALFCGSRIELALVAVESGDLVRAALRERRNRVLSLRLADLQRAKLRVIGDGAATRLVLVGD
jgi:hypothetical protein